LVGPAQTEHVTRLFAHCDIPAPDAVIRRVLNRLSFENLSGGRKPGDEDTSHKYRSGKPGDWRKYFDDELEERFCRSGEDLLAGFGYS
jgi:hypothetical protein